MSEVREDAPGGTGEERGGAVRLPAITVIIPTLCSRERSESIVAAVRSVLGQRGVLPAALIAVNGDRVDEETAARLAALPGVELFRIPVGNVAKAVRSARTRVRTEAFAFLDDDDVLLEGSLAARWELLARNAADVAVGNGHYEGRDPILDDVAAIEADPLARLASGRNWLASSAGLFRASSVGEEFFDGRTRFHEWTLLAFKLLQAGKRIRFTNHMCYRLHETPGSAWRSASAEFHEAGVEMAAYLRLHSPPGFRAQFRRRWEDMLHDAAEFHRTSGDLGSAWTLHARSLAGGGWRFAPFTLRLAWSSVTRLLGASA